MNTLTSQQPLTVDRGLSGNALKLIACAAMVCDHAIKVLPGSGTAYLILSQLIGRIAFPIFSFFLVEGFLHTHSRSRYLLRLVLFAVIAEVPFDLTFYGKAFFFAHQNTLWTLTLGFLLMLCLDSVEQKKDLDIAVAVLLHALLLAFFGVAGHFLHVDYHARGVLSIAILFLLQSVRPRILPMFWSCVCLNLNGFRNPGAFLAVIPLRFYNGTRGHANFKYAFYIFYPLHLIILLALSRIQAS